MMLRHPINSVGIQNPREGVVGYFGPQSATRPRCRKGPDKIDAADAVHVVEIIILRNVDLVAIRMLQMGRFAAALFRIVTVEWVWKTWAIQNKRHSSAFLRIPWTDSNKCGGFAKNAKVRQSKDANCNTRDTL